MNTIPALAEAKAAEENASNYLKLYRDAILQGLESLAKAMKSRAVERIDFRAVPYVGSEGDYHSAYVAIAFNDTGELQVIDEEGEELEFLSVDPESLHSILSLACSARSIAQVETESS